MRLHAVSPDRTPRSRPARRGVGLALALAVLAGGCSGTDRYDAGSEKRDGVTTSGAVTTAAGAGDPTACPTEVDAEAFASADDLEALLTEFNEFGMRSPGSHAHEASLDWLGEQFAEIPGMEVEWDPYDMARWEPTTEAEGDTPGRDLAAAGAFAIEAGGEVTEVDVIGAVPFSAPTDEAGISAPMVYLTADEPITAANAAGKVVVQDIVPSTIPMEVFDLIAHHLTDDLDTTGVYDRPYLRPLDQMLTDAGLAGAAGLVILWDAPTDQLRGYWDPHSGTRYHLPSVFVGSDRAEQVRAAATEGASGRVVVRAEWADVETRNLIATLPGGSRERIVITTNTDSVNWVQENGTVAAIALARYLGALPAECRARDVQFALTSNHLGYAGDGTFRYGQELDRAFEDGTVAFVMAPEHLGVREILPIEGAANGELAFTGEPELFAWSAPDESPALIEASVAAVKRRGLDRTAVLKGVGLPSDEQVPSICSQGGLGTNFHGTLLPTIAAISGPWSLWAPAFGKDAIDFERMRDQTLAFGDVAVGLDDVPLDEIVGGYPEARAKRAAGFPGCDIPMPPEVAPAP